MFTPKKLAVLAIVALCLLTWTSPALGQAGADVPPPATLHLPHDVDRLPDGHTLITDGGQAGGLAARGGAQPGSGSKIIEVDEAGNVVWLFDQGLSWAHNADRLPGALKLRTPSSNFHLPTSNLQLPTSNLQPSSLTPATTASLRLTLRGPSSGIATTSPLAMARCWTIPTTPTGWPTITC